jgi:hypothetical protein
MLLLFAVGCGSGSALTIHNGTDQTLTVQGLPGGPVTVAPGALHFERKLDTKLSLTAGPHSTEVPSMRAGGGAIWSIGGTACFVEADFAQYYELPADISASAEVAKILPAGETLLVSDEKVFTHPGQRLPKGHSGGPLRAFLQVPCAAAVSEPIARAWVEMMLPDIQPN